MNWWEALVLGLVEGITEYLPVSSTGHLLLTQRALGIRQSDAADAFAISIQAGAIVAILGLYRARFASMLKGLRGADADGRALLTNAIAAFLPAVVIGLPLEKLIKTYLFGGREWGMWPIALAWLVGGLAILLSPHFRHKPAQHGKPLQDLTLRAALLIGLVQCIAMWPGVSRSLVTILGGLVVGLSLPAAVEFSFILGLVTLSAATAKDAVQHGAAMLEAYGPTSLLVGFAAAWISAVIAVKWMVGYLNRHGLMIFGFYRVALAVIVALLILTGQL